MTRKALKITAALALSILVIMSCGRDISDDNSFVGNFRAEFKKFLDDYYVSNGETNVPVKGPVRFQFPEYSLKLNDLFNTGVDPKCPFLINGSQITLTWDNPPITVSGSFHAEFDDTIVFEFCQTCTDGVYSDCKAFLPSTEYTLTVLDLPDSTPGTTVTFTTGASPNTVAPVITIDSHSNNDPVTGTINIILTVTDDDTATPEVVLTVDGGGPIVPKTIIGSTYDFEIITNPLPDGIHTFTFSATDFYQNTTTPPASVDLDVTNAASQPTPFITDDLMAGMSPPTGINPSYAGGTIEAIAWDPSDPTCDYTNYTFNCMLGQYIDMAGMYLDGPNDGNFPPAAFLLNIVNNDFAPFNIPANSTVTIEPVVGLPVIAYIPQISLAVGEHILLYVAIDDGSTFWARSEKDKVNAVLGPDINPGTNTGEAFEDWVTWLAEPAP